MKRLRWSKLLSLAAMGLAVGVASAQVPARIPATYPSANPQAAAGTLGLFEGPNATDYFNFQQNFNLLANPQIAVGPEDILMVVNSQIFRTPNGNAPGVTPTTLYPNYTAIGGQGNAYQRAFLDNWIGEAALNQLCPTGAPSTAGGVPADTANTRSTITCRIENSEVKYDQMHGRFLVLFTVVDTGLTFNPATQGYAVTRPRKASWVLAVSRFAVLLDQACIQGTQPASACTGAGNPNPAGTNAFVMPTPGTSSNTGGINTNLWAIYFGNALGTNPGDGFGSNVASSGVGAGNINALPGISASSASFDCSAGAIYPTTTVGTKVCYFPTAARLGIDNDTITIVSPVINANVNSLDVSSTYNPAGGKWPAYAGNRVRVIKKSAVYNFKTPLAAGNQFAGTVSARTAGDYYDLFTSPAADGSAFTDAAGGPPKPYTALASSVQCTPLENYAGTQRTDACTPLFYEPAHLRGRAMATFSNSPTAGSQTYLVGTVSTLSFRQDILVQGIREVYTSAAGSNTFSNLPFYVTLQGGNSSADPAVGFPTAVNTNSFFTNPGSVSQQGYRTGSGLGAGPNLFVGDDRPHSVIFREGHLYDARVAATLNPQVVFPGTGLTSTVVYDVVQKLGGATAVPATILTTQWQNSQVFAPMFDVPANVKLIGQVAPSSILPYLEKVFAATTFPPLAGMPVSTTSSAWDSFSGSGDPRSRETFGATGIAPIQLPAQANCFNYQLNPGVPLTTSNVSGSSTGVATNAPLSWASLFDIRCGQDVTDSNPQLQDPISGQVSGQYAYTVRGSAAIDPNDGSMWEFGAYAQKRNTGVGSVAHWGTMVANYKMTAPAAVDEYGNATNLYSDTTGLPEAQYIAIATNVGLVPNLGSASFPTAAPNITPLPFNGANATLYPAGSPVQGANQPGAAPANGTFGPNDYVTRREMAAWIVKSQMDEAAIASYLASTSSLNGVPGANNSSFADVPTSDPGYKYIEVMARRGYTSGCAAGVARRYCPDYISTRKDLAVFMIRAKFSNVFPSVLSGCSFAFASGTTSTTSTIFPPALTTNCGASGDNFGLFVTGLTYFNDNPAVTGNDEYAFLQKMRELRITNGTSLGPLSDGRNGHYARGPVGFTALPSNDAVDGTLGYLLRKQVATFMVRGFFF